MALPEAWDEIEEGTSAVIAQMVSCEQTVKQALDDGALTKEELLAALLAAQPDSTGAGQVEGYMPSPHPRGAGDIENLQQRATTLQASDQTKLDKEKRRIEALVTAAQAQDSNQVNQALLQVQGRLQEVKAQTDLLAEMDPITGKSRNELLQSALDADTLEGMGNEQKSEAFRKIGRDRIAGRRASCVTVSTAILQASRRPAQLENIHAGFQKAASLEGSCAQAQQTKTEALGICEAMRQHLAERKRQLEVRTQARQKTFQEQQQAAAALRKTLQELKQKGPAYSDATAKLHVEDAALDIDTLDVQALEQKLLDCERASELASTACQSCHDNASAAATNLREAVKAAVAAVLQHAKTPCTTAFVNVLAAQALVVKADEEVTREITSLSSDEDSLKQELANVKQLWESGQATDLVADRSAVLKDGLASIQTDLESAKGMQQQLRQIMDNASVQKKSFVDMSTLGFSTEETANQRTASTLVEDCWGSLKIMAAARKETIQAASLPDAPSSASSSTALQQQIPDMRTLLQQELREAVSNMREQMMMDVRLELMRHQAGPQGRAQGSEAGSWIPVEEPEV